MIYLVVVRPLQEGILLKVDIANEVFLYLMSYGLVVFCDYNPDFEIKMKVGWIYITLLGLVMVINLIIAISTVIRDRLL